MPSGNQPEAEQSPDVAEARDGCVVATAPLTLGLQEFVAGWRRTRPATTKRFSTAERGRTVDPVSPVAWLAAETHVDEDSIKKILKGRKRPTELRIADPLVSAIGHPEWLHDGTLKVVPNPAAPAEAQASCCSGSLTGSFRPWSL